MKKITLKTRGKYIAFLSIFLFITTAKSQVINEEIKTQLSIYLNTFKKDQVSPRHIQIDSFILQKKKLLIYANEALEDIPFREKDIQTVYQYLDSLFPDQREIILYTRNTPIESLIPEHYRKSKPQKQKLYTVNYKGAPLTTRLSRPNKITKGLQNRHIALWQSHGMYYHQATPRWEWQRARLFGTVEDLYTQSFVLPYLLPMLENAGANVLIPRERDIQLHEVIIDNDGSSVNSEYIEKNGNHIWLSGNHPGFAHTKTNYINGENPFQKGSFRQSITQRKESDASFIEWHPELPEAGEYAVYVSYKTLPNSTEQAHYTITHSGGESLVSVNQTMSGGTWVYIGHYSFDKGKGGKITLTNQSNHAGKIITADAIKIGGGMGNIARSPRNPEYPIEPETSGYPRFTEAARYWLQWAGMPDSIYSNSAFENDYSDDIYARAKWVNFLKDELNVPIDMAFAFHSDAGITPDDSIIGTLGIYMSKNNEGRYTNKKSRETARDLTDIIQSQIVSDIRQTYNSKWSRRGMWNQSYIEARVPDVPTMLLEILSHQNFADMRYGLDPRFRFTVSRAIYKGMLRYISFQNQLPYIVQPLPPSHLHSYFSDENEVFIGWESTPDLLEPTAIPSSYILYTRIGEGDFDNGIQVKENKVKTHITPGILYSYKVAAVNEGGNSFPSEILTVYRAPENKGTVLIVNGFDRISSPASFQAPQDSMAGFQYETDFGVPYIRDISFVGNQYEFRRSAQWITNDQNGHGDCYNNYAGKVIAGNTFDYPYIHGKSIAAAGYSFVSCSHYAVTDGQIKLTDYPVVDLILGKQKQTFSGSDTTKVFYKAFPSALQEIIRNYCDQGGKLFVSGAHVLSDLLTSTADSLFASQVLHCLHVNSHAGKEGSIRSVASPYSYINGTYSFHTELNPVCYAVQQSDALKPADRKAHAVFRYPENNMGAGVAYKDKYQTFVLGFPFETIKTEQERTHMMKSILQFFQE